MRPFLALALLSLPFRFAHADGPTPELAFQLKGSIAKIHTVTTTGGQGLGSGVVVAENLVATNCHVLADSNGVNIGAAGETYIPVAVKEDWQHDVCLLKFEFLPLKPVALGDSETLQYEQPVFAIGFPGGPPKPLTTFGVVKALYAMDGSQVIRASSAFMLGASGSPLFDAEGRLVGLNTFKSPGHHAYYYSVPVQWIKRLINAPDSTRITQGQKPFWAADENQRPYFMRVVMPMQNGEWGELQKIATEWAAAEPGSAEARYYLALADEHLGFTADAQREYAAAARLNPRHVASLQGLNRIAQLQHNEPEALRTSMLIHELVPEDTVDTMTQVNTEVTRP